MKNVNYFMLRTIFALVIGLVLIIWPANALIYLVITIGILFMVPGMIAILGYLLRNRERYPDARFPLTGAGSLLFGILLLAMPGFFVSMLMYLVGFILVLGGIQQIVSLSSARKWGPVPGGFYVVPVLILLCGVIVLFNPFGAAATALVLLGVASMVYGVSELVNWFRFGHRNDDVDEAKILP